MSHIIIPPSPSTYSKPIFTICNLLSHIYVTIYSMQQAIPYKSYMAATATAATANGSRSPLRNFLGGANSSGGFVASGTEYSVTKLVLENAVIVFGRQGCCMCHVVKRLLLGLGVNPPVCEVDEEKEEAVLAELSRINGERGGEGGGVQFPAVFVGGKLFGGLDRVMSTHISGELVPILKDAGALWL
ncbi:glutaredoxin-C9 [Herrania umbratica]|uniref:Glutaredoxin-C9 n=1 Tax=Herrania umbratica TaxID=108875 RepID=A0A6J1B5R7_9ROSI|nr:glutaredoxin-C9 [Herrania umbratica]